MLIISDFHDYYDPVMKTTGVDKSIVFQREEKELTYSWLRDKKGNVQYNFLQEGRYSGRGGSKEEHPFISFVIGFCGKTYHGVRLELREQDPVTRESKKKLVFLYEKDAFDWVDAELKKKRWCFWDTDTTIPYWKGFQFPVESYRQHKSPILLLTPVRYYYYYGNEKPEEDKHARPLVINPRLKDWGFSAIVDPFTAFQEIQMFISGVLGTPEKDTVKISDKNKIVGHGFDPKWSFRKPPQEKTK